MPASPRSPLRRPPSAITRIQSVNGYVAGRWSYIDLDSQNIDGGRLTDTTVGLNWYWNRFTKIQFNFIHALLNRPTGIDSDADIFALRAQVDF